MQQLKRQLLKQVQQKRRKDGPLEDWTEKELAGECSTLGLFDEGTTSVLISRTKEARESVVEEAPAEEAAAEDEEEDGPLEGACGRVQDLGTL